MTTESSPAFIERMKEELNTALATGVPFQPSLTNAHRLITLAEERVMVEEHRLDIQAQCEFKPPYADRWAIWYHGGKLANYFATHALEPTLSDAIRNCVAKIKESP